MWGTSWSTTRRPIERVTSIGSAAKCCRRRSARTFGTEPAGRAASRPSPLRPLPAERCSGITSHEGGETFPVVGAGRRRHLPGEGDS
jgi:hypothetical protein